MTQVAMNKQGIISKSQFETLKVRLNAEVVEHSVVERLRATSCTFKEHVLEFEGQTFKVFIIWSYSTVIGLYIESGTDHFYLRINYNHSPTTSKHHNNFEHLAMNNSGEILLLDDSMLFDLYSILY